MIIKEKSKQFKVSPNNSKLDQMLWLIENYLPQKKDRVIPKKVLMKNLDNENIKYVKYANLRVNLPLTIGLFFFSG